MPAIERITGDEPQSRKLITAGWDDVPHLDRRTKADLLAETPEWLREARSKGIPSLGAGAIYPIADEKIRCDPFQIPHYWPRCFALDVGWNWTAALWAALDRETLTTYLYAEYKAGQALAPIHAAAVKARGKWIPGVIDPAANNRSQRDGEQLMADYINEGLILTKAANAVESGLVGCWRDLTIGRIKVFSTLTGFFEEKRLYRRDEHGKIVKKNDHLMDCMRYIYNSGRAVAIVKPAEETGIPLSAPIVPSGGY